jgi:cysteine desulfurase
MARQAVYLDYHATTPVDRRVVDAMLPFFTDHFGNASSSTHAWGWRARDAVEASRRDVASLIGAASRDIVFTSGATESNNLAIAGVAMAAPASRRHIVVSAIEHKAVLEPAHRLEAERGWRVSVVPVLRDGRIDLSALEESVTDETALVSVMAANNEIGVLQPLREIATIAHAHGSVFHTDAAQAAGKVPMDVDADGIDLLSLTAHKFYGPKGCGALYVRRRLPIAAITTGGGQEHGLRAGTLNVPGIVGLGAAAAICKHEMTAEGERLRRLRDRLLNGLSNSLDTVIVNGSLEHRLPHNLHVSFPGIDGESLLLGISDIAVSSSSACASSSGTPSHVLAAITRGEPVPSASIRFGLGRPTTDEDIDYAIERFVAVVRHLRNMAPV